MTTRLILVGGGGFGRELINWADHAAAQSGGSRFQGFLDSNPDALAKFNYKLAWLGSPDDFQPEPQDRLVLAIGDPAIKRKVVAMLRAKGAQFASLIHPSAVVAHTAVLSEGVILCPHTVVSADAFLGEFTVINALSSIGHDVHLGAYSTLSAHVDVTGFVTVGEGSFFGTGAKVLPKVKIGARARIGAGTTIMRAVPDDATMYILPAKRM